MAFLERPVDEVGDLHHVVLAQSAGRHGRGADADAAGFHDRLGVEGNSVFVHRDGGLVQNLGGLGAGDAGGAEVNEHHMVVGAAGDDSVAELGQTGGEGLGIVHNLAGVVLEIGLERLAEANGLRGDHMHEWSALNAWEGLGVDFLGELLLAQDEAGAGSAQAFVRGGGDKIGVREGRGVDSTGDEPRDVGHVDEKVGANGIGDLPHALEIDDPRVGRGAGGDHFWANLGGLAGEGVVVDRLGLTAHAVVGNLVEFAGEIRFVAVGEVAAVGEVHGEDFVAGGEDAEINGHVRLTAAVGLNIGVLGAEELLRAVDSQRFHDVHILATAIPAFAGIALGIFVGEARALGLHDRAAGEILARDEFDVLELAAVFLLDRGSDLGVGFGEGGGCGTGVECGWHGILADESHHGRQGLFDAAFAFGIDRAALANGIRHIGGAFFIEPEQADLVNEFGEKQIEEPAVVLGHHENVGGLFEEFLGDWLAAEFREFHALGGEDIDGIAAGGLALARAEAGGLGGDVARARGELSKQRLRHGAAAHIARADKEDMAVSETHAMPGTLVPRTIKSNARSAAGASGLTRSVGDA